jgi:hypothetical protein
MVVVETHVFVGAGGAADSGGGPGGEASTGVVILRLGVMVGCAVGMDSMGGTVTGKAVGRGPSTALSVLCRSAVSAGEVASAARPGVSSKPSGRWTSRLVVAVPRARQPMQAVTATASRHAPTMTRNRLGCLLFASPNQRTNWTMYSITGLYHRSALHSSPYPYGHALAGGGVAGPMGTGLSRRLRRQGDHRRLARLSAYCR